MNEDNGVNIRYLHHFVTKLWNDGQFGRQVERRSDAQHLVPINTINVFFECVTTGADPAVAVSDLRYSEADGPRTSTRGSVNHVGCL